MYLVWGSVNLTYRPTISLVAGLSGMGKSTLVDRILGYLGEQVQCHSGFHGKEFSETQVLWLRRNVPEHCSVGTLCSTFGDYTDRVLRMSLYGGIFDKLKRGGRDAYLAEIRKIITTHHVGLLVLDEFQNLSLMGVGAKKIIALLVNLRDELGLPIVVVGTYKALRLLEGDLSIARRLVEGGYFDLERPTTSDDSNWQELCEITWQYQWIREPIEYSSDIGDALFEVSQGITGIMLNVFVASQLAAMEDGGHERVDADLIRHVFKERMKPLHQAVRILKSGDPRLLDKFDDIYNNLYPTQSRNDNSSDPNVESDSTKIQVRDDAIADLNPSVEQPIKVRRKNTKHPKTSPALSEDQIKKLVTSDSMLDLISILDNL
ncbi:AAA family ATPase [Collimonas arenae]|uniref:AAA family ATPase n=1 Tax=Collimonas arenae TaxID=279058 RepID=UPI002FFBD4A1